MGLTDAISILEDVAGQPENTAQEDALITIRERKELVQLYRKVQKDRQAAARPQIEQEQESKNGSEAIVEKKP